MDWEYVGWAPRYADEVRFWSLLPDRRDRDTALELILEGAPQSAWKDVGALALWLSLRLLGENAKAPAAIRNADDLEHARRLLPEAYDLARRLGGWPRWDGRANLAD